MAIVGTCCQGISIYGAQVCCDSFGRPSNNSINILIYKEQRRKAKATAPSPKCMLHFCIEFHIFFRQLQHQVGQHLDLTDARAKFASNWHPFSSWQADGNPRLVYKGNFNKSSLSTSPYPSLFSLDIWVFLHSTKSDYILYFFSRWWFLFFLGVAAWLTDCVNKPNTHTRIFSHSHTLRIDKSMWKFININFSERQLTIDPQSSSTIGIIHSTSAQIAPF